MWKAICESWRKRLKNIGQAPDTVDTKDLTKDDATKVICTKQCHDPLSKVTETMSKDIEAPSKVDEAETEDLAITVSREPRDGRAKPRTAKQIASYKRNFANCTGRRHTKHLPKQSSAAARRTPYDTIFGDAINISRKGIENQ
jgi:G:T/U-mismatch repair DNA glycosylase